MTRRLVALLGLVGGTAAAADFHPPARVRAGEAFVKVESPGYACPCLADVDADGKPDLLVGQFRGGKIKVHKGLGDGKFAPGAWLEADGKPAEVPGVW
jgi:hypothetical protein